MRCVPVLVTVCLTITTSVSAQTTGWRWSVAGGPSLFPESGPFAIRGSPYSDQFSVMPSDTLIRGGRRGRFNLAVGASRPIPGTSLQFRAELLYNRNASTAADNGNAGSTGDLALPQLPNLRNAIRDDAYAVAVGTQWDALPGRRWSPYLLTSVGFMHSRLSWSRGPNADRPDDLITSWGPFASYGAGVRVRFGRVEYFSEWRRQLLWHTLLSSRTVPISLGLRF